MSEFIELTVDGEKHLFNTETIFEAEPHQHGCRVYQNVGIHTGEDFVSIIADESYETVKSLIVGEQKPLKVTVKEVKEALTAWQRKDCLSSSCEGCKYNRNVTVDECEAMFITDYLNGMNRD